MSHIHTHHFAALLGMTLFTFAALPNVYGQGYDDSGPSEAVLKVQNFETKMSQQLLKENRIDHKLRDSEPYQKNSRTFF